MQKLIISVLLGFFIALPVSALAGWVEDFINNFGTDGIEVAVTKALENGETPDDIIEEGLKLTSLNPQNMLKALYCAGVDGNDIKQAANDKDISDILIVAAFNKSVAECGDVVADSQAYTPAGPRFSGMPSPGTPGGSSYASRSSFQ